MTTLPPEFTLAEKMALSPTQQLACQLLAKPSISPHDEGCQPLIAQRLTALGFTIEWFNSHEVTNLWATRGEGVTLLFAGHTDVVPAGQLSAWQTPPFTPMVDRQGFLRARGAADMKSGLAAFITAIEDFVNQHPNHLGRIAVLLTSDEESLAIYGTRYVVEQLRKRHEKIEYCIVGEPSSNRQLADTIKNGRRGSLTATLKIIGIQGHVAYHHKARNAIHIATPILQALQAVIWDQGNEYFPPTALQVVSFKANAGATNIIPGEAELIFNLRYSSCLTAADIMARVDDLLAAQGLTFADYELTWQHSGEPFFTETGCLLDAVQASIVAVQQQSAQLSTSGGTSDGRFIATMGTQVIELGPINATIHQIDERIHLHELDQLHLIYRGILERLLL